MYVIIMPNFEVSDCLCVMQDAATPCDQDKGDGQGEDSSTGGEVSGVLTVYIMYTGVGIC